MAETVLNSGFFWGNFCKVLEYTPTTLPTTIASRKRTITMEEVSDHDTKKDCWIVIYDRVYNVTNFLDEHTGGCEILLEYAGRDASFAFRGYGHTKCALRYLTRYLIGELPEEQKIFRKVGGFRFR